MSLLLHIQKCANKNDACYDACFFLTVNMVRVLGVLNSKHF